MIEKNYKIKLFVVVVLGAGLFLTTSAFVATSTNYHLQSDTINTAGVLSTSTNYRMEDTTREIASGVSTSTTYKISAGYQQMMEVSLAISPASDITMSELSLVQHTALGSTTWSIITDNVAGYSASVYTEVSEACSDRDGQGAIDSLCDVSTGESFADILESKHLWDVSNEYAFGWSAYGDDVSGNGPDTTCAHAVGVNVPSGGLLWQGFHATTTFDVASSSIRTSPTGTETVFCLATEQDTTLAPSGDYEVTVMITAVSL